MRSRIVTGSVGLVLLLAMVSTCRQESNTNTEAGQSAARPTPSTANSGAANAIAPATSATQTTATAESRRTDDSLPTAQTATITANDPDAQVNVRSQPSQAGESIGYGSVGESVLLGRSEADAEGYTWYYVTFENDDTGGWVRSDLLDIPATASVAPTTPVESAANTTNQPPSDTLKRSLDDTCGGTAAIEAYFVTPSNTIYICKVRNQRTYLSQEAGTEQVVTVEEVEALGGGYMITNGNFEYRLDSSSLVVVRFDDSGQQEEVLRESVVYSERY